MAWPTVGRVAGNGFVDFDDDEYVTANVDVLGGISAGGLEWAFTTFHANSWHPLTWLSLQLDSSLFGPRAAGFHLTNLVLHAASTLLLFRALLRMTGLGWRSAAVAALFAVHPLHVESVAWVPERKDVLGAFFWFLTLLAYRRYAKRPNAIRSFVRDVADAARQRRGALNLGIILAGNNDLEAARRHLEEASGYSPRARSG